MNLGLTGAVGCLGRAILDAALAAGVDRIVAYDQHEQGVYQTRARLGEPPAVRWIIGDVTDQARLERALWGVDTVIHAAARKWVASGVANIDELTRVNVGGTMAVIEAARRAAVTTVLVITSDKGVEPTTSYGATKLLAEQYAVQANAWTYPQGTAVAALRFGNLLWPPGSVAHVWRAQAAAGKPLPLTRPGMTRFGIRRSDAARLSLRCAGELRGGEIFVPALRAYRLEDLAAAVAPGAEVSVTGDRGPGEKAHETLLSAREVARAQWLGWTAVLEPEAPTWTRDPWRGPAVPAEGWTSDTAARLDDLALEEMDAG